MNTHSLVEFYRNFIESIEPIEAIYERFIGGIDNKKDELKFINTLKQDFKKQNVFNSILKESFEFMSLNKDIFEKYQYYDVERFKHYDKSIPYSEIILRTHIDERKSEFQNINIYIEKVFNTKEEVAPETNSATAKKQPEKPTSFKEIFTVEDWKKYILALSLTTPAIINSKFEFIGRKQGHTGVVASWIFDLQAKGLIKTSFNRKKLALILMNEIKYYSIGLDAKTMNNVSKTYDKKFREQLKSIAGI